MTQVLIMTVNFVMNFFSESNAYYAEDSMAADGRSLSLLTPDYFS